MKSLFFSAFLTLSAVFPAHADTLLLSGGADRSGEDSLLLAGFRKSFGNTEAAFLGELDQPGERQIPEKQRKPDSFSMYWRSSMFFLTAGRRFQPGPGSGIRSDPNRIHPMPEVPGKKKENSIFFTLYPIALFPGIFFLEGFSDPGIFLSDSGGHFSLMWHEQSRSGSLSFHAKELLPFFLILDMESERGYSKAFYSVKTKEYPGLFFASAGLRRPSEEPETGITNIEKNYRTIQIHRAGFIDTAELYSLEALQGWDREDESVRSLSEGKGYIKAGPLPVSVVLRMRNYILQSIHKNEKSDALRTAAFGLRFGGKNGIEIIRERETKNTEIYFQFSSKRITAAAGAVIAGTGPAQTSFLFLNEMPEKNNAAGFYSPAERIVRIRIRSRNLAFRAYSYIYENDRYEKAELYFQYGF